MPFSSANRLLGGGVMRVWDGVVASHAVPLGGEYVVPWLAVWELVGPNANGRDGAVV